jgi:uncharacterized glyoxalase superfamily protein PhnB
MPDTTTRLYPTLRYSDPEAAIRWLVDVLGFTERVVYRDGDTIIHAELSVGGSILMLGAARDDAYEALRGPADGRRTDSLYLAVPDADAVHARVAASGATVVRPVEDTSYGSREFLCRDREGNLWSIGTYAPQVGEAPL